ncbi:DNA-directed RNA polymerase II subunit rpb1 [Babesia caballi]|uniref:DNA-directed RNA polymerase II subunit rpb1 n=1 Tax=Babesia caballi TaxID=5871 RepID=A0AAV4LUY8_BABCB|nr:DNA-directed RNA polymerase II subunit rpb1 [Babesia caballi]
MPSDSESIDITAEVATVQDELSSNEEGCAVLSDDEICNCSDGSCHEFVGEDIETYNDSALESADERDSDVEADVSTDLSVDEVPAEGELAEEATDEVVDACGDELTHGASGCESAEADDVNTSESAEKAKEESEVVESSVSEVVDSNDSEVIDADVITEMAVDGERSVSIASSDECGKDECEVVENGKLPDSKVTRASTTKGKKLQWVPKASVPAYVTRTAKKFNIEEIEKIQITAKGKGVKDVAAKSEEVLAKVRQEKLRLKEEVMQNKMKTLSQRAEIVAAEKARVIAAKKAREEEAERIRLEAIARRRMELQQKKMEQEEFQRKMEAVTKARRSAMKPREA